MRWEEPDCMREGVEFRVTDSMVERFAELTGDRSSLHTNQAFAERSAYRRKVVHGMLPVTFITALSPNLPGEPRWSVVKLSARFLKPSFVNDRLSLSVTIPTSEAPSDVKEVEFAFKNLESGAIVTTGRATFSSQRMAGEEAAPVLGGRQTGGSCLVNDKLSEQAIQFEQIKKGQGASFQFQVTVASLESFLDLIAEGLASHGSRSAPTSNAAHETNVMAACLVSTFAGMCLPGKYATLMECSVAFARPIRLNKTYTLTGTVQHVSRATSVLSETLLIQDSDNEMGVCATGKVSVKVNEPATVGPSMDWLRQHEFDLRLKNQVVLITGGSRGIGETTAKLFALYGAKVVVNYRQSQQDAERVVEQITSAGGEAIAVQADVTDRGQVRQMMTAIQARYETVHILVNNAVADAYPIPFMELTWDHLQRDLDVTLKGAFNCCQEVLPLMQRNGGGKIINLSSVFTDNPPPLQTKYVVSKSALTGLTRSLAVEFAPHHIQVNLVQASIVETDLSKHVPKIFLSGMKHDTPMKRHASTGDVAKAVVFLASALSSFTTGQRILVTGGNPPFL